MRRIAFSLTLALVFAIPWEDSLQVSGFGTISRAIGVAASAAWLVYVSCTGTFRRPSRFHVAFFLFVVWNGLTAFWSLDPAASITGFLTYVQLLVLLVMMWELFTTRRAIELALQAYVLGGLVTAGLVLQNFFSGHTAYYLRYGPPGADVDGSALILALGIPAALHLAVNGAGSGAHRALRVVNFAYVPASIYAIVLTATRGAVVASIPSLVFCVVTLSRGSAMRRAIGLVTVVAAVVVVVKYAPTSSLDRIGSASGELSSGGDLNGRVEIWHESIAAFLARPIGGVGHDAHRAAISIGKVAHNTPLSVVVETGLVGALLFANVLIQVVALARRLPSGARAYWVTQLSVIALGSLSLSVEDRKAIWFFAGACVASSAAYATRRVEDERRHLRGMRWTPRNQSAGGLLRT